MSTTMGVYQLQCGLPRHHHPSGGLSPVVFFQGSVQQHHLLHVSSISPPAVAAILSQKMSEQKRCVLLWLVEVFLGNGSLPVVSEAFLTAWHGMVHGLVPHGSFLEPPVTRPDPALYAQYVALLQYDKHSVFSSTSRETDSGVYYLGGRWKQRFFFKITVYHLSALVVVASQNYVTKLV